MTKLCLTAALLLAVTVPALAAGGKDKAKLSRQAAMEEDSFDPTDEKAAMEHGISKKKLQEMAEHCRTHLTDKKCMARRKAQASKLKKPQPKAPAQEPR